VTGYSIVRNAHIGGENLMVHSDEGPRDDSYVAVGYIIRKVSVICRMMMRWGPHDGS
jgi:hypothetical protein